MSRPADLRRLLTPALTLTVLVACTAPIWAGTYEDSVRARWRGAWVVIDTEIYSDCNGAYKTNKVSGRFVTSSGLYRFDEGELAKVDRVQVKGKKVELHTTLDVNMLASYSAGPFTLYAERECRVQFQLLVPKEVIKAKDVDTVDRMLAEVVERHPSRDDAYTSEIWNGRERESYPDDYELTLAYYEAWKAEQRNLTIDSKLHESLDTATSLATGVVDDPAYLSGFASGSRAMRAWTERDCGVLVGKDFGAVRRPISREDAARTDEWKQGYSDGQHLVYSLALLERLDTCYVEVPAVPGGLEATSISQMR